MDNRRAITRPAAGFLVAGGLIVPGAGTAFADTHAGTSSIASVGFHSDDGGKDNGDKDWKDRNGKDWSRKDQH